MTPFLKRLVRATADTKSPIFDVLDNDAWLIELSRVYLRLLSRSRMDHEGFAAVLGLGEAKDYRALLVGPSLERASLVGVARAALAFESADGLSKLTATPAYIKWQKTRPLLDMIYGGQGDKPSRSQFVCGPFGMSLEGSRLASNQTIQEWSARIGISPTTYLNLLAQEQEDRESAKTLRGYAEVMATFMSDRIREAHHKALESAVSTEDEVRAAGERVLALVERRRRDLAPRGPVAMDKPKLRQDQVWVDFSREVTDAADEV